MNCAWNQLLSILPPKIRTDVDQWGREGMQELRLRINGPPELVIAGESRWLSHCTTEQDLQYVVNTASRYSPWAVATVASGYLTAPGGHRIGLCGEVICKDGRMTGIRHARSLCIRVARDYRGIWKECTIPKGSILILGAPGWGKTTLLRDLARQLANQEQVCVVDEREELFPTDFLLGKHMDVLTGCPKQQGIDNVLRTMGPSCIAVDEITAESDCHALLQAANCGVRLIATAHGASVADFQCRTVCRSLVEQSIFQTLVLLHKDKSYTMERMTV